MMMVTSHVVYGNDRYMPSTTTEQTIFTKLHNFVAYHLKLAFATQSLPIVNTIYVRVLYVYLWNSDIQCTVYITHAIFTCLCLYMNVIMMFTDFMNFIAETDMRRKRRSPQPTTTRNK